MLAASTIAFFLLKFAPGDAYSNQAGSLGMSRETQAALRAQHGEDRPLAVQYVLWLRDVASGNLGYSTVHSTSVSSMLADALPNTLQLMALALVSSVLCGVALGAWQGAHLRSRTERITNVVVLTVYSLPEFCLAMVLLLTFALHWRLLPPQGMVEPIAFGGLGHRVLDRTLHFVLPWLSLTLVGSALFARYQRAAMRDVIDEPFVRTAHAKGVAASAVLRQHALRLAILPVITVGGLLFPALLTGAVLVEKVFAWPGMGRVLADAVGERDRSVVTGVVIVASAMTALGGFLAEVLREVLDPRLRS